MKDRLSAAMTALDPFLADSLASLAARYDTSSRPPGIGLWACPLEVGRRVKELSANVALKPRVDDRAGFDGFRQAGAAPRAFDPGLLNLSAPAAGADAEPDAAAIVLPVPSRDLSLGLIAAACANTAEGALVMVAGTKDQGIDTIAKRLRERGFELEKRSKAHAVALRFAAKHDVLANWLAACAPTSFTDQAGRCWQTAPGVFSHGRLDRGTALLRQNLPSLSGSVADFGGGWGALVPQLFDAGAERVHLYEASAMALALAKANLSDFSESQLQPRWTDLETSPVGQSVDHVVMNPPFHTGKITRSSLGATFIRRAHEALRPGGSLTLVANVHLGYEHVLTDLFGASEQLAREDGFKILQATRRR